MKDYKSNDVESSKECDKYDKENLKESKVIDSILEEITSARLKQAIILSEIVGKPKSKTRKRRI